MAKRLTQGQKDQVRAAARHPVAWLKGKDLPPDKLRPWELAIQIVPPIIAGLRGVFDGDRGWLIQNVFHVDKGLQSVMGVISAVWDGVNDPLIGAFMDYRNYPSRVHRRIMRVSTVLGGLFSLITVFDFGLSPVQRVAMLIAFNIVGDFFGTASGVAGTKVYMQITPHSAQRAKLITASKFGGMISYSVAAAFWPLLGLRDVLGIRPYNMYVFGAAVFFLPQTLANMLPTLVMQRVPDPPSPTEKLNLRETFLEIKESFLIVRHNKWFVMNTLARLFTMLTPNVSDTDFYRFCRINETVEERINGWKGRGTGELLYAIRNFVTGAPGSILQPFAPLAIKKLRGPRNMLLLNSGTNAVAYLLRYLVGVKSIPGILFTWGTEALTKTLSPWVNVSTDIIKYEMLDYVEWKTGRRSEGVTSAVEGLLNKVVLNNIDMVVGNWALKRIGFDVTLDTNQPENYVKWATVFYFISRSVDHLAELIAYWFYRYPGDSRERVEAQLIERRRLAKEAMEVLN